MKTRSGLIIVAAFSCVLISCQNPFSPRGPFNPRLVVYSVLSNTRTAQFARVYSTYNPPELNPYDYLYDSTLTDVNVRMTQGSTTFLFRDTLLQSGNQDSSTIAAFVSDPFPVTSGMVYSLEVVSTSLGVARSTMTVPAKPSVSVPGSSVFGLDNPGTTSIGFTVSLSNLASVFLVRMFVEFETTQETDTLRSRMQVPLFVSDTSFSDAMYPSIQYRDRLANPFVFSASCYVKTLSRIFYLHWPSVKFKRVVFEVTQVGESLHNYSSIVNGFRDELSLRVDQPDFSNISGGFGLFGAFTKDEFPHAFPQGFSFFPPQ